MIYRLGTIIILLTVITSCNERFDKTQASADTIISALNKYESEHGSFPKELIELIPDYLAEIPKTDYAKEDFIYEPSNRRDKKYFELIYLGPLGVEARYNSLNESWSYDD